MTDQEEVIQLLLHAEARDAQMHQKRPVLLQEETARLLAPLPAGTEAIVQRLLQEAGLPAVQEVVRLQEVVLQAVQEIILPREADLQVVQEAVRLQEADLQAAQEAVHLQEVALQAVREAALQEVAAVVQEVVPPEAVLQEVAAVIITEAAVVALEEIKIFNP